MSYTRYESSSYNRDDDVRDRNTTVGTGNNTTIRRSWDDTDRSNTNNNGDLYFSRTTTYRDSDRDRETTGRPYTTGPFGTGSYTTGNTTYTRDSDYNRGNTTGGYTTTTDRYASGTSDRYTGGERGTSSYDRGYPTTDRYTTGPRTTGYTGDVERFNVDRSNDRGYTGYSGETRGYTGESRGYVAGSDVFNRRGCETCPDTYNYSRGTGHSATCDYNNTRGGYGYTATTDYNRGYTDRDTYGPRNFDRDTTTTTTRYTTDFRGGDRDNYTTGNRGFGGYTTGTRSTF